MKMEKYQVKHKFFPSYLAWTALFFFLQLPSGKTQQIFSFELAYNFLQTGKTVQSDPLGFFYLFKEDGELLKLDTTGKVQFRYSTTRDGDLSGFDPYNGLQTLCWFKDFQKIIVLNRTLQPESEILLSDLDIFYAGTVKTALDGNIWVYDENNFQLKKINPGGKLLLTGNRLDLVLGQNWHPVHMVEYDNHVYLTDPDQGILVLDVFGNFIKTLPITGVKYFFIRNHKIFYLQNFAMQQFDLVSLLDYSSKAPELLLKAPRHFWEGKYWYQIFPDQIKIFRYKAG
ncbi:MAG: hypothetical protein KDC24_10325 [Saprospiraceae bacterium]|nr:hypothetical protein [Saprospiraceae bacterium]